jgi:hypothetical protein
MPYKADKRYYLTEDGKVVEEGDAAARTLLIGEGGEMPLADARKYGLVDEGAAEEVPAEKATPAAPANKAVSKAPANKAAPAPPPAEPNAEVPPADEPPPAEPNAEAPTVDEAAKE